MQSSNEPILYSRRMATEALLMSMRTLDQFIKVGEIKPIRVGRKVLIPRSEVLRFARSHHQSPFRKTASGVPLPEAA